MSTTVNGIWNRDEVGVEKRAHTSIAKLLLTVLRKTLACFSCNRRNEESGDEMEIGWPTNVRYVTRVTFDRFQRCLGPPSDFEKPNAPSDSANVIGVLMKCSNDPKRRTVPTILLLMQEHLYTRGGLKAEGIFRINWENSQENHMRDQLSQGIVKHRGIIPKDIEVHCLAGLIKAWFRELPKGLLDGISPEHILNCNSEEELMNLLKQLQLDEFALLIWAIDLMADVVEEEEYNKMNARNTAMVFAPIMTQMSDRSTALMYAVQVTNFLKTLILIKLREREPLITVKFSPTLSQCSGHNSEKEDEMQHRLNSNGELRVGSEVSGSKECDSDYCQSIEHKDDTEIKPSSDMDDVFLRQQKGKMKRSVLNKEPKAYYTKRGFVNTREIHILQLS